MPQIIQAAAMAVGVAALITGLHLFYKQSEKRSEIKKADMAWIDNQDKSAD